MIESTKKYEAETTTEETDNYSEQMRGEVAKANEAANKRKIEIDRERIRRNTEDFIEARQALERGGL